MLNPDLLEANISDMQSAMVDGQVLSRDLVVHFLARVEAYDQRGPALNAISAINKNAIDEADRLDRERADHGPRSPLHGIPVLIKDNFETDDMQTAGGSILLKGWIPPEDAFLVKRLRSAGAIILAKTNMHEFASGITTVGSLFGATRNPYNPERNPGGSSGGTGAALAANFGLLGWGSDTCGSVRVPAAHNCLVGLRGTQGLLSRTGIIPLSHTQDIAGPLARSVTDVALALDATVGYDPDDPQTALSLGRFTGSYRECLDPSGLAGAKIGMLRELLQVDNGDAEIAEIIRQSAVALQAQGADVREVSIPALDAMLNDRLDGYLIIRYEFKFDLDDYLARRPSAPVRSLAEILDKGQYHPALEAKLRLSGSFETLHTVEYRDELLRRRDLRIAVYQALVENGVEVLVYPSIRRQAARVGEEQSGSNCRLSAKSGLPAITVPAGFTNDGLPVGLEILGRDWDEPKLLKFAYAFEQATRYRRPPKTTPAL